VRDDRALLCSFSLTGIDPVPPPESSGRLQHRARRVGGASWLGPRPGANLRVYDLACEQLVLLGPVQRQINLCQTRHGKHDRLATLQDRLDQLWAQKGETNETANVAPGNAVTCISMDLT
jgi:hypothetical protein